MSIKRVVETRQSHNLGKNEEPRDFLTGLRIGPYRASYDNPGISFVAEKEGSPNGIYVRRSEKQGVSVHIVPSQDLTFDWSSRAVPTTYGGKMPYPVLPELSSDTTAVLMNMIGTERDYFARIRGIRASAQEVLQGGTSLKEKASEAISQQGHNPGVNLNTLLARVDEMADLESYVSPDEQLVARALDEVFGTADQEMLRKQSLKGRIKELCQRVIF
ncbi:hypothetical protein HYU18_05090 [Candidatus Woesearchaeota archaeon]|nr:hypothetical protein [Candidatus Woesearchaeota archaeon]